MKAPKLTSEKVLSAKAVSVFSPRISPSFDVSSSVGYGTVFPVSVVNWPHTPRRFVHWIRALSRTPEKPSGTVCPPFVAIDSARLLRRLPGPPMRNLNSLARGLSPVRLQAAR